MNEKPFNPVCERNGPPIVEALARIFADRSRVLEIGSGTGQHAVFFASRLSHLRWQPSDVGAVLPGIQMWVDDDGGPNVEPPIELDVLSGTWPGVRFDALYSANTLHYMPESGVDALFAGCANAAAPDVVIAIYGPFNRDGAYTSPGNAQLDAWLQEVDPSFGIRDREHVIAVAARYGFTFVEDCLLPANNHLLVWQRFGDN